MKSLIQNYKSKSIVIVSVFAYLGLLLSPLLVVAPVAHAEDIKDSLCGGASLSVSQANDKTCAAGNCYKHQDNDPSKDCVKDSNGRINDLISSVINIFSLIVGIIAVIMIILGGFRFITSGGDSGKISSAKTTVVYAIVGLIIVALAQVIVRFVLGKVT